jgi:hypothetical protein
MWLTQHAKDQLRDRRVPYVLVKRCFNDGVVIGPGNKPNTEKVVWGDVGLIRNGDCVTTLYFD